ncbi:hypothetical protein QJS10_CPB11g01005 [Acorus calamus]|uniref:Reverse transcriptase n=1 Tax=Acorus calamus TaxID=4465 RepID=A0AAV9DVH6_ACOCL|nr:hypothetical protein QJS10_CPB11g01005 [Acorus calamus]
MQGQKLEDSEEIRAYALENFSEHWASKIEQLTVFPMDLLPQRVPNDMVDDLIRPFSMLEIEKNKAPGPDGYPSEFYQRFWTIIKEDVYQAIAYFHRTAKFPPTWGSMHIALIPKVMEEARGMTGLTVN